MSAKHEVEVEQAQSEANKNVKLPEHVAGERRGRSIVQSVRLPEADFADIEQLATELDIPVSALIRGWVLAGLADDRNTPLRSAIERLAEDADRLRRLAIKNDVA